MENSGRRSKYRESFLLPVLVNVSKLKTIQANTTIQIEVEHEWILNSIKREKDEILRANKMKIKDNLSSSETYAVDLATEEGGLL